MGVYVHIPFCAQKCYYCDFHSVVVSDKEEFSCVTGNYLISLRKEALYYRSLWGDTPLKTLFIGGGTPSLMRPKELASLIVFLKDTLPFVEEPEISIEANPHSLTLAGATVLAEAGVNRVSLGVQAFQDSLLEAVGRIHRREQIDASVAHLRQAGIQNINLDLIFGLPGQSHADWIETLELAIALGPKHLSCYGLILEDDTPLAKWVREGLVEVPNDDQQAEMFDTTCRILKGAGFEHYEISNFCEPGWQCQHNLIYWQNRPFIGLGSGSTGYLRGLRYRNAPNLQGYLESWTRSVPCYEAYDEVSSDQEMDETMMVGMRLLQGIDEDSFRSRYGVSYWDVYGDAIKDLLARGLVTFNQGRLRVTYQGLLLENQVSGAFLR